MFKSAFTLECWDTINIAALNRVDLIWVLGHSGITGNGKADKLARLGAASIPIGPEPLIGSPYSHNRYTINKDRNRSGRPGSGSGWVTT